MLGLGLWTARSLTGCAVDIPVGAMSAEGEGGELPSDGTGGVEDPSSGGTGGRANGGRANNGGTRPAGGSSAGSGGTLSPAGGFAGEGAGSGGSSGNFGGAGSGQGGGLGVAGAGGEFPDAGNAGTFGGAGNGSGGTGGTLGNAGSGGTVVGGGGYFGYAGATPVGVEAVELPEPERAPCAQDVCRSFFEWRVTANESGHYEVLDISGDGNWLVGPSFHYYEVRGFRLDWERSLLWLLPFDGEGFIPFATSYNGDTLVGGNRRIFANQAPEPLPQMLASLSAQDISNSGGVIVANDLIGSSMVVSLGTPESLSDLMLYAVSGDGEVLGGRRTVDNRAVIIDGEDVISLPDSGEWRPQEVTALSDDGSVAVGFAVDSRLEVTYPQAFRWERGGELELLGYPPNHDNSVAYDCDAACEVVVGSAATQALVTPWVYRPGVGLRDLQSDVVQNGGAVVPAGLSIARIQISADGQRIAGSGALDGTGVVFRARFEH
jgi:hypothetical protein